MKRIKIISPETHPLTWRINNNQTIWIKEYISKNGYKSLRKALTTMDAIEIINIIKKCQLKGRGGAGFLTGVKWELLHLNELKENRYLICNADEMEPGTYKDRFLMEHIPHLLIEGIIIAAYALKASISYVFLRDEYSESEKILNKAIGEAKDNELLGDNILNSGFNLNIFVHTGAGRYICGEETALINSLEGYRANPRSKPPFPAQLGIWGKPTCINNVETLCNIPAILEHGVEWYRSIANKQSKDTGTKLMGFSGKVKNPGIWELPFGTTAREVLEEYAYGMKNNLKLKAWLPGGISTGFLIEKHLDCPMDFENISLVGSRLGTAISIAIDNNTNIISLMKNIEEFFFRESCGLCTPCRDGLSWIVKLLNEIDNGYGYSEDIKTLEDLSNILEFGKTFCAHAVGASEPLKSAMYYFESDFKYAVKKNIFNKKVEVLGIQENKY